MAKIFNFKDLTDQAKKRAIKDYRDGWKETHPEDELSDDDVLECVDDEDHYYKEDGRFSHQD